MLMIKILFQIADPAILSETTCLENLETEIGQTQNQEPTEQIQQSDQVDQLKEIGMIPKTDHSVRREHSGCNHCSLQ